MRRLAIACGKTGFFIHVFFVVELHFAAAEHKIAVGEPRVSDKSGIVSVIYVAALAVNCAGVGVYYEVRRRRGRSAGHIH